MLSLSSIRAGYAGVDVIRGVDLVVPTGATVALLGPNGAGKTTLMRVAAGLIDAWSGTVELDGVPLDRMAAHDRARRGVCFISGGGGIFRDFTVRDNIVMFTEGGCPTLAESAAVQIVVDAFPILGCFLELEAGRLSGGQQQMLALSRALVTDAPTVLADELSLGLAPVVLDELFGVLGRLHTAGRSLLLVEQYVDRVLDIADYVYLLNKGSVAFVGEPEQCRGSAVFDHYVGGRQESPAMTGR